MEAGDYVIAIFVGPRWAGRLRIPFHHERRPAQHGPTPMLAQPGGPAPESAHPVLKATDLLDLHYNLVSCFKPYRRHPRKTDSLRRTR